MAKFSLINIQEDFNFNFQEGDQIVFEMPPFCTGEYKATVKKDPDFGLYINSDDNCFKSCRDFVVYRNGNIV
jgi:hypothetical protein